MSESMEQMKTEIECVNLSALEYREHKERLELEKIAFEKEIVHLKAKVEYAWAEGRKNTEQLLMVNWKKMTEIKNHRDLEKDAWDEEMDVNEKIRERLQKMNDQLVQEIKEVKQIVKIPRLHYKEIEKSNLATLNDQYDKIKYNEENNAATMK